MLRNQHAAVKALLIFFSLSFPSARSGESAVSPGLSPKPDAVQSAIVPVLTKYCVSCHNTSDAQAGLDLTVFTDEVTLLRNRSRWETILRMVRASEMPPKDEPQPSVQEREGLLKAASDLFSHVDCSKPADPGRVTIRRLNRLEYNNTVRDLTGVELPLADDFPADDIGYGFDHIGDVLSLPPVLFEKYLAAAEKVMDVALREGDIANGPVRRFLSREMLWTGPGDAPEKGKYARHIIPGGELRAELELAVDSEFIANVRGLVVPKCRKPFQLELRVDGSPVTLLDFTDMKTKTYPVRIRVPAGKRSISVALINEGGDPEEISEERKAELAKNGVEIGEPRFHFEYIDLQGPIDLTPTLSEQLILIRRPTSIPTATSDPAASSDPTAAGDSAGVGIADEQECAAAILSEFIRRAFRRPVDSSDVEPYTDLFRARRLDGESYIRSLQTALSAVLISPQFLFRIETGVQEPSGQGGSLAETQNPVESQETIRQLTAHELATRLSYFLWSTMPDDELFQLADQNKLQHPEVMAAQIRRMLADPKRDVFVRNFAGQWLQLRNLSILKPDPATFPLYDESLRTSMVRETEACFEYLIHEDRSILELLDSDYTFVNERLARHYGIDGVSGDALRKVSLTDGPRGGVLTHGSILTVTSNPTRTSPVKRGKWILENILGTPPPPPPPMVELLDESPGAASTGSLRERMVLHRSKPGCASCHERMDPLGFGLENFDGIGSWRTMDGNFAIDPSGDLPSGESFRSPQELRTILLAHRDEFARCLAEKMLTYGLGRGIEYYDRCAVDRILERMKQNDYRFSSLVLAVVDSEPFRRRRAVTHTEQ